MEPITSGSTTERIVRTSLVTLLAIGAALYCFYDGYVRYPMKNLRRAVQELDPQPEVLQELIIPEINADTAGTVSTGVFLRDMIARFGEPGWRVERISYKRDENGALTEEIDEIIRQARFFGPAGQIILDLDPADRVKHVRYERAMLHGETDLFTQKAMGIGVSFVALLLVLQWFRVMVAKAALTNEGIKLTVRPLVPFDAMTALRAEHYGKKGWVDLDYELDGRAGTLRLDDYKIKAFPEIIAEICRRKGFEDPHKIWHEEKKAAQAASE